MSGHQPSFAVVTLLALLSCGAANAAPEQFDAPTKGDNTTAMCVKEAQGASRLDAWGLPTGTASSTPSSLRRMTIPRICEPNSLARRPAHA